MAEGVQLTFTWTNKWPLLTCYVAPYFLPCRWLWMRGLLTSRLVYHGYLYANMHALASAQGVAAVRPVSRNSQLVRIHKSIVSPGCGPYANLIDDRLGR